MVGFSLLFFFSSRRRHTRLQGDWSSDVCSSDLAVRGTADLTGGGQCCARYAVPLARAAALPRLLAGRRQSGLRSEERRVGKECRSRWAAEREKQNRRQVKQASGKESSSIVRGEM